MEKDPISGNEVPKGALPEEVRDDVPAMLSEGEFVIPADVVRYIGLDKLRKLRDSAKKGLQDMDAEGQIGGEPARPADMPNAAKRAPQQPMPNAADQTQQMLQPNTKSSMPVLKQKPKATPLAFAEGGDVATRIRGLKTPASSYEMKMYVSSTGGKLYVPVINGVPTMPIPEGYTEQSRTEGIYAGAKEVAEGPQDGESDTTTPTTCPDGYTLDPATNTCVPVQQTSGESEEQETPTMSKYDLVESIAKTLGDEALAKEANDAKWASVKEGFGKAVGFLSSPLTSLAKEIKGDDKESKAEKQLNDVVEKIGAKYDDPNIKQTLDEALNGFKGDKNRAATGAAQVTVQDMAKVDAEIDAKITQAMIANGYTPAEAQKMAAQAKIGLLNSPAAKDKTLGKHMTVPTEPNMVEEALTPDKTLKEREIARKAAVDDATKAVADAKAAREQAAADRADRIADEDLAMGVTARADSGGSGSLVTGKTTSEADLRAEAAKDDYFQSLMNEGSSGNNSGSDTPTAPSNDFNSDDDATGGMGGAWIAKGGLISKKALKRKKKKLAITKK
jgi:hypothetical protein